MVDKILKIPLPKTAKNIISVFENAGYEIYIVGGVIRDILLKRKAVDWDFTTNAEPETILSLFPDAFYDNQFGTVGIADPNKKTPKRHISNPYQKAPIYEITTFRKEDKYSDSRHPDEISWGKTLSEDLERRDFTVNAMAIQTTTKNQPPEKRFWEFKLIDLHNGIKDIGRKLIRAVGNPDKRFQEDALRMMRAVRIATQLEFSIETETFAAINRNAGLINNISIERARDELLKLLSYPYAADGYLLLRSCGLARLILPEVEKGFGVSQKSPKRHHIYDVGTHAIESLRQAKTNDPIVKLAILLHDVGKPNVAATDPQGIITFYNHEMAGANIVKTIGQRLKLTRKDQDRLWIMVRWHQFTVDERQTDKAIRRFIRNVGKENLNDMLEVRRADRLGGGATETSWRFEAFKKKLIEVQKQPFTVADLKVDGNDVMKIIGISPGPMVGKILNQLFAEIEEDKNKNKKAFLLQRLISFRGNFLPNYQEGSGIKSTAVCTGNRSDKKRQNKPTSSVPAQKKKG